MSTHQNVVEELSGPEELTRKEVVWGIVCEPPAPEGADTMTQR